MISESVWNLGGTNSSSQTAKEFYEAERGEEVYTGRPTKWTGKVGLMYASDYKYAVNNDSENWLFLSGTYQWTLNPLNNNPYSISYITSNSSFSHDSAMTTKNIRPIVYLDSKVKLRSGEAGTNTSPFVLKV